MKRAVQIIAIVVALALGSHAVALAVTPPMMAHTGMAEHQPGNPMPSDCALQCFANLHAINLPGNSAQIQEFLLLACAVLALGYSATSRPFWQTQTVRLVPKPPDILNLYGAYLI